MPYSLRVLTCPISLGVPQEITLFLGYVLSSKRSNVSHIWIILGLPYEITLFFDYALSSNRFKPPHISITNVRNTFSPLVTMSAKDTLFLHPEPSIWNNSVFMLRLIQQGLTVVPLCQSLYLRKNALFMLSLVYQ